MKISYLLNLSLQLVIIYFFTSCGHSFIPRVEPSLKESSIEGKTIKIGNQIWTARNLDVDQYRNGDPIPQVQNQKEWRKLRTGAWCYYFNNEGNNPVFGKLYNWYAVTDPRGLGPEGWHVPSQQEWDTLITNLGGKVAAGRKMKEEKTGYVADGFLEAFYKNVTNESVFTALPAGFRTGLGPGFKGLYMYAGFWSSSSHSKNRAWLHHLIFDRRYSPVKTAAKTDGFSVRLVCDNDLCKNFTIQKEEHKNVRDQNLELLRISGQVWMENDLDVDHYQNGDKVPYVQNSQEWSHLKTGAWCYVRSREGFDLSKLYNWYAVNDPRGLAPKGYHIPNKDEWEILKASIKAGKTGMYLTDKVDLHSQNPMAKASSPNEFMAIPNGIRSESGGYYNYSKEADYWSSSESSENNAYSSKVRGEFKNILIKKDFDKRHGFSVRCIADHENIQGREVSGINTTAVIPKQEPRISRYDDKFVSLGLGFGLSANFSFVYPIDDFNSQWFKIRKTSYSPYEPSNGIAKVKQVSSTPTIGPHLAFLASIQFNKYLEIRFLPTLTIAARKLIYDLTVIQGTYIPDTIIPVPYYTTVIKYISTVGLSFPVDVKFKFPGSRQFRFYLVAGLAYGINFNMGDAPPGQSNAPLNSTFNNFGMSAGIGINFYRDRLKFGIELKNTYGFLNILEKDGYVYTESIKSIHSDIVQLTFTIERIMFLKRR